MARERTTQRGEARASTRLSRRVFVQRMAGLGAVTVLASCTDQVATPKLRRIGYLSFLASTTAMNYAGPFRKKLRELGYVEGRDIEIVFRAAELVADRLPDLAAELVAMPVDVLIAEAQAAHLAAKDATKTIPIVITLSNDPIGAGLVQSLSHPGGNITGFKTSSDELAAKRVQLLKETVPSLARIGIIWNATLTNMMTLVRATENGARSLKVETQVFDVHNPGELGPAVETMAREHLDGLVMLTGLSISPDRSQVPNIAAKHRLPQMFSDIEIVRAGGLMHFGANYAKLYEKAALYVDKLLKGAKPSDLPLEQATDFDFIINQPAARRIGLPIPSSVLLQATEVIP